MCRKSSESSVQVVLSIHICVSVCYHDYHASLRGLQHYTIRTPQLKLHSGTKHVDNSYKNCNLWRNDKEVHLFKSK